MQVESDVDICGLGAILPTRARDLAEEFGHAVDAYERTGAVIDVAAAQLYAARKLVEAGRRSEAELYLQPALAFYRSVGATLRVRQGEALLAATA